MKNKIIVVLALFLLFASCEKNKEKRFTGKYLGTYTHKVVYVDLISPTNPLSNKTVINDYEEEVLSSGSFLYLSHLDFYKMRIKDLKLGKEYVVTIHGATINYQLKITFSQNEIEYTETRSQKLENSFTKTITEFWGAKDY